MAHKSNRKEKWGRAIARPHHFMTEHTTPEAAFNRLVQIITQLRAPDGCPWDREQTHLSLRAHLLEETYEALDAIEAGDDVHLSEELGDVLMQPLMHAQIAAEENRFDIADVIEGISAKLVRRHPHVFGTTDVADAAEVLKNWDAIKRTEKAERQESTAVAGASALDDTPEALPALMLALKISKKAAKVGFEWPDVAAVMDKLREEIAELETALHDQAHEDSEATRLRVSEELGDVLFTAVNVSRWQSINPELALRDTVNRFRARFAMMEQQAQERGVALESLTPQQWNEMWEAAKVAEA